ncbi:sulfatase family protein [Bordetella genomosp. 12]|uniref:Twin-arginine translocation pathway signal protein n=1 Tax=Bordetella genomosp. 12 TaxID=463035 RepID=A0A261VTF2_9BORD|nr:sulfatase-like hydrolase/transferase [Bordetella genomosp. 12]OZI77299.1 twin-arginine translocation pathway signal protein [Bordetella genomosp. 12]
MTDTPKRPNFIFIMADDLGYADLGCYGGRAPVSPHLDQMAAEGVLFTEGYSNSPVCSPTRFALMTGRYQYRLRGAAEEPLTSRYRGSPDLGLSPEHPTLPSLLRDAGYHTVLVGKWHLGFLPHFGPLKSGYDEFFGAMGGGLDYFTHKDSAGTHDLYEGETETHEIGYLTDLISERAVRTIEARAQAGRPFLMSVHYTAPHWPWETRDDTAEAQRIAGELAHTDGGSVRTYQTMIHHMDEGIGRILATLRETGLDDNTIVVFTSDNGAERFSDTWPLVGKKMDLLEGGIRVPLIVRGPGHVSAGRVSAQVAITMDWVATFFDWAGVAAHPDFPLDGMSLCSHLRAVDEVQPRSLFWRMKYREQRAMRQDHWKYLAIGANEYLFDLSRDERERANQARREPERLAAMRAAYDHWSTTMPGIPQDANSVLAYTQADIP